MKRLKRFIILILFLAIPAAYTLRDMRQAEGLAAEACRKAVQGMTLDEYFSVLPQKDYTITLKKTEIIVVAKGGMGRYRCVISHDGRVITGARTGSPD